jgi:calcium/proton exchanger cax
VVYIAISLAHGIAGGVLLALHLNPLFAGLIVFPGIIGLAEMRGAIGLAWANRIEITFAVASGSVINWALLGVPVLVIISHVVGLGALPLLFGFFLVATLGIGVGLLALNALNGEATWLEGFQMLLFFAAVAVVASVTSVVAQ